MKRAATLWWLTDRRTPWLRWWQEWLLNWVASWDTISTLVVISADGEDQASWDLPSDLQLHRMELEELLQNDGGER